MPSPTVSLDGQERFPARSPEFEMLFLGIKLWPMRPLLRVISNLADELYKYNACKPVPGEMASAPTTNTSRQP
jgi:hypothetical protein